MEKGPNYGLFFLFGYRLSAEIPQNPHELNRRPLTL